MTINNLITQNILEQNKIKKAIHEVVVSEDDPRRLLKEFDELMKKRRELGGKVEKNDKDKLDDLAHKALRVLGFDNHYPVAEIAIERDRPLIIELCNQLVEEYKCITISEKVLVHLIGGAYARNLVISRYLTNTVALNHTTPGLNNFISIMSKEIDRSSRQITSAISTLKQFKSPTLKVNIKTNNAFIAQNQQLNSNPIPNETNNP